MNTTGAETNYVQELSKWFHKNIDEMTEEEAKAFFSAIKVTRDALAIKRAKPKLVLNDGGITFKQDPSHESMDIHVKGQMAEDAVEKLRVSMEKMTEEPVTVELFETLRHKLVLNSDSEDS